MKIEEEEFLLATHMASANVSGQLEKLKNFASNTFVSYFGNPLKKIREICEICYCYYFKMYEKLADILAAKN